MADDVIALSDARWQRTLKTGQGHEEKCYPVTVVTDEIGEIWIVTETDTHTVEQPMSREEAYTLGAALIAAATKWKP